ncbi:Transcriptional regulatory protein QseF [Pseudovibrio axinellae]|uniref:Transcriptional regulatory protein QseF n=1 Tax=Pseudovibrio axinellae TaxID=989403 RepID=A0A165SYE7_9HYPH|nr:sigma-54 dependent transcriptional regulator [Pseudovibrio axinellae]KZL05019.1 Transcriptional regulatory protein QseF [Pseudovibrio axinellae]SER64996.1 sigma-54 specific transcriptional regulator [Pseudovibrio axinellae]
MMAITHAQAAAVYLPDITGRKLVPMACDGGMPFAKLPELSTELEGQPYSELNGLKAASFFYKKPPTSSRPEDLSTALFGRQGTIAGHWFSIQGSSEEDKPNQVFVFLLVSALDEDKMNDHHQSILLLWRSFYLLRPLLHSLKEHQQNEKLVVANSNMREQQIDAVLSEKLVGCSTQISEVREQVARFAQNGYSVLVLGETGTGKEVVAGALHRLSTCAKGPYIAENISALPPNLIESELFGYKKGAFTGADSNRDGLIKRASGGTLFLDEIGDLSFELQVKLLRVLQEKTVRPLGAEHSEPVSFRLITATHVDLRDAVNRGHFRSDLFYRISQLAIALPPLRERDGDILHLARFFLQEIAVSSGETTKSLSDAAEARLQSAEFKGNVRELQNCMIKAVFLSEGQLVISENVIDEAIQEGKAGFEVSGDAYGSVGATPSDIRQEDGVLQDIGLRSSLANYEQRLLRAAFDRFSGDRGKMAEFLRLPRRTLANKLLNFNSQTMEFEHDT